ncbi:MAG: hypothetical protein JWR80_8069 [Bradyrhizobium sp.]|nr:hypothetical protein [Bradyrhizobium sp.]
MEMLQRVITRIPDGLIRATFWVAVGLALLMALLPQPPSLPIDAMGDKSEHVMTFVTLTLLAALGYRNTSLPRIAERLSFLGALIEIFQSIPALHRDCDFRDWIADTLAIIVTLILLYWSGIVRREQG